MKLILFLLTVILSENVIFSRALGVSASIEGSETPRFACRLGGVFTAILTISSALSFLVNRFLLDPLDLSALQTMIYLLLVAGVVLSTRLLLRKFNSDVYLSLEKCFSLVTADCAVLGVLLLQAKQDFDFGAAVAYGFASALGCVLAVILIAGIRERLQYADPPKSFEGLPLLLIAVGLMALAFSGFSGLNFVS